MTRLYTLLLLVLSSTVLAQQPFAVKPYAITLPRVTTAQQESPTTVPQSVGNVVYNTDQQKIAVSTGADRFGNGQWQYVATDNREATQFSNVTYFLNSPNPQTWTIPDGVTKFMVELWGGGTGATQYDATVTYRGGCLGGQAGGYARKQYAVVSGATTVTVAVGKGGSGTNSTTLSTGSYGTDSRVSYPTFSTSLVAAAGYGSFTPGNGSINFQPTDGYLPFFATGGSAPYVSPVSYIQKDASNFLIILKLSDGGLPYGVVGGVGGIGQTIMLTNNDNNGIAAYSGANYGIASHPNQSGIFPGGGGACALQGGGVGANGLVIIRW